jgi:hypothetical protein
VEEYFMEHDISYPLDVTGTTLLNIEYVGIKESELLEPGAQGYIEEGIMFAKEYFEYKDFNELIPGARAMVIDRPVFFKDESGKTGLMVRVTAYGEDEPGQEIRHLIVWMGSKKKIWKVENFIYFNRNDYQKWQYEGKVY